MLQGHCCRLVAPLEAADTNSPAQRSLGGSHGASGSAQKEHSTRKSTARWLSGLHKPGIIRAGTRVGETFSSASMAASAATCSVICFPWLYSWMVGIFCGPPAAPQRQSTLPVPDPHSDFLSSHFPWASLQQGPDCWGCYLKTARFPLLRSPSRQTGAQNALKWSC